MQLWRTGRSSTELKADATDHAARHGGLWGIGSGIRYCPRGGARGHAHCWIRGPSLRATQALPAPSQQALALFGWRHLCWRRINPERGRINPSGELLDANPSHCRDRWTRRCDCPSDGLRSSAQAADESRLRGRSLLCPVVRPAAVTEEAAHPQRASPWSIRSGQAQQEEMVKRTSLCAKRAGPITRCVAGRDGHGGSGLS